MRRWLAVLFVWGALFIPFGAKAQNPIKLSMLQVQLWPEYDQPSMLVIYDFKLPDGVKLPVNVSMTLPKDAGLVAVASQAQDGSLLNADYTGPTKNDAGQTITIPIQTPAVYHLEYYQPLSKSGTQRQFTYQWPGTYAVDDISVSIRLPPDTTRIVTDPDMKSSKGADGNPYLVKDFGALSAGQPFPLQVSYFKTTEKLGAAESVQPSQPLSSSTPGRVFLLNYVKKYAWYILGGIGVIAVAAASVYLLQPQNRQAAQKRLTHRPSAGARSKAEVYCHQCGARAEPGDRFCRVCGTRLRAEE